MGDKKPRDRVWLLPTRVAKDLAKLAGCELRTIQAAASGRKCNGDSGERAMTVVADYFDLNPSKRPAGWRRPSHAPLQYLAAARIAGEVGVDVARVQRIAGGIPSYDEIGTRIVALIQEHYEKHPEDRPDAPTKATANEVRA